MQETPIIFEQPLNELIRVCLRLEHLFNKVRDNMNLPSIWASRAALAGVLELVNLIDRPDLKTKLNKSLSQHATYLTQLRDSPQVDSTALNKILDELDEIIDHLYVLDGKLGQRLRDNEFLSGIRSHLNNPGGPCDFSLPAYQLWLHQPATERTNDLHFWFSDLELAYKAVKTLLRLTRESKSAQACIAPQGFYQQNLDPNIQAELIRVIIPAKFKLYPEVSVGRHRVLIRFYEENITGRGKQTETDVQFRLAYCAIHSDAKLLSVTN